MMVASEAKDRDVATYRPRRHLKIAERTAYRVVVIIIIIIIIIIKLKSSSSTV